METSPGLWKFRFDSDAPAQRLGALHPLWIPSASHFPVDAAVSRHGAFLLNRSDPLPRHTPLPTDRTQRIFRWDQSGFHACTTDLPIPRPAALAADPLSPNLYVLNGESFRPTAPQDQTLLRLRPAGPDRYTVETIATDFSGLGYHGLQITADGLRIVITDENLAAAAVLKRVQPP